MGTGRFEGPASLLGSSLKSYLAEGGALFVSVFVVSPGDRSESSSCGEAFAPGAGRSRTVSATVLSFRTACSEKRPPTLQARQIQRGWYFRTLSEVRKNHHEQRRKKSLPRRSLRKAEGGTGKPTPLKLTISDIPINGADCVYQAP